MDESSPLLSNPRNPQEPASGIPKTEATYHGISTHLLASLIIDSIPVMLSYILQNSVQLVSILVTGRLGPAELSATAFSMMLAFVTG